MLRAPNKEQRRLLELADFIEGLDADRFSMSSWGTDGEPRCICGWFMQNHGLAQGDWETAAVMLGLDRRTATHLFQARLWSKHEAVKQLRSLAFAADYRS